MHCNCLFISLCPHSQLSGPLQKSPCGLPLAIHISLEQSTQAIHPCLSTISPLDEIKAHETHLVPTIRLLWKRRHRKGQAISIAENWNTGQIYPVTFCLKNFQLCKSPNFPLLFKKTVWVNLL